MRFYCPNGPDDQNLPGTGSKIQHSKSGIGGFDPEPEKPSQPPPISPIPSKPIGSEPEPVPMAEAEGPTGGGSGKIRAFGKEKQKHEEKWTRTPNSTSTGAIHVKTFHSKLTADALIYMDQVINEWLDSHPQYDVKFVNSTVGIMSGKLKEPAIITQVWV
jgi:hypothetical protein